MPSQEEIETALHTIATRFREPDLQERFKGLKRDVVFTFTDLNASYLFKIREASIEPTNMQPGDKSRVEVVTDSTTFLGILNRTVDGFAAFTSGKLKVHGPISDLLKLQELLK